MALLGIRFLWRNFRIFEACAPNRSLDLEKMSTNPERERRGEVLLRGGRTAREREREGTGCDPVKRSHPQCLNTLPQDKASPMFSPSAAKEPVKIRLPTWGKRAGLELSDHMTQLSLQIGSVGVL